MLTTVDTSAVTGQYVLLEGEQYYRIGNSHLMPEFYMSLVGASDHWMFISSHGALTAGRRNADNALFPYAPDDQISAARAITGPCTLLRVITAQGAERGGPGEIWEPFSSQLVDPGVRRNLYKTPLGNKLVFEEVNESLQLVFRYRWTFSQRYGFVRSCHLENTGTEPCHLQLLDGLLNILPYGVGNDFVRQYSNLANAYKKSELVDHSQIGLFYLSSIPTDRAEPSEGLKATTVWQTGLTPEATLISANQLTGMRRGQPLTTETDIRGTAAAYLVAQSLELESTQAIDWQMVAELAQDHGDIIALDDWLQATDNPASEVQEDVQRSEQDLLRIVSNSDGLQCSADLARSNRHLANTVFNVMRGGVPLENYRVDREDFLQHVIKFNQPTFDQHKSFLESLPDSQHVADLCAQVDQQSDRDLTRLSLEYLPLAFSRRHGDPTRPWNRFSIDLRSDQGRTNLNYQGNWRDIFQNWEALALSYPEFLTAMICRFVNATTADGYNPYRLTKDGFEWEEPSPDDPWANIGYWGDHQIIYLLKLMQWSQRFHPGRLSGQLDDPVFVHANVPYRIKDFDQIRRDPRSTIVFDDTLNERIGQQVAKIGADGKLLRDQRDEIHHVTLAEKLLTLSLAKLSNFVPDGGIWLNTQRPEWNDANNALVGNGLSMVTTCYLHRWFKFLVDWISESTDPSFQVSAEVAEFFAQIDSVLTEHAGSLTGRITAERRSQIVEALSRAGSQYRNQLYADNPSGTKVNLSRQDCLRLLETARRYLAATIKNNQRPDGLYHAYNLLDWNQNGLEIEHLYEMLEGQVAVLSADLLSPSEAIEVLDALGQSSLYRENQQSYLLYPDRQLPRFLQKNELARETVDANPLLQKLLECGNESVVRRDVRGGVHFNGSFRNSSDLQLALDELGVEFRSEVANYGPELVRIFESIFDHRTFTGRSGTFFAYEGLGSIYWHMVSKLGLAVSENFFSALDQNAPSDVIESLRRHLESVRHGIGAQKSPQEYGAFPTDPYSHTPENAGVKQPGMTGQVKEDVLARFAEIGVEIEDGCLCFRLDLYDQRESLTEPREFSVFDVHGERTTIEVPSAGFAFTLCQVPITYQPGPQDLIRVHYADGQSRSLDGRRLDADISRQLFHRTGEIQRIECQFTGF